MEALQQEHGKAKIFCFWQWQFVWGVDQLLSTKFVKPRRKRRIGDVESVPPSFVETVATTAAQVEPIYNPYPSPVIGQVSPTDPCIRPADQSPTDELVIDEEEF